MKRKRRKNVRHKRPQNEEGKIRTRESRRRHEKEKKKKCSTQKAPERRRVKTKKKFVFMSTFRNQFTSSKLLFSKCISPDGESLLLYTR